MNPLLAERQLRVAPDPRPIGGGSGAIATDGRATVVPLFPDPVAPRDAEAQRGNGTGEPLVLRRALFERLDQAGRVTTVSAPAGSGKTWLLSSWLAEAGIERRAAWATVGRDEYDGQRFWASVVDALVGITEEGGPSGDVPVERLRETLERIDEPAVLVIDDLHELQSADALVSLERFLTNLPGKLRVVLLTRRNPRVRLHRLRLAGELTELRAADMRFSLPETHATADRERSRALGRRYGRPAQAHGGMGRRTAAGDDRALGAP